MASDEYDGRFIVLIKPIGDKKLQYVVAKKLHELLPHKSFTSIKEKLGQGGSVVALRTDNFLEAERFKSRFEDLGAETEITEQAMIGGADVF